MYIKQCYKYKINNIIYLGGNSPEGAEILETMNIFNIKIINNSKTTNYSVFKYIER
jgi:hypothetical protein